MSRLCYVYVTFTSRLCHVYVTFMSRYGVFSAICIEMQGAILIPILLYLDGTWLSSNSNHTAKPMKMGIGNHPIAVQHDLRSKKVTFFYYISITFTLRFRCVFVAFSCACAGRVLVVRSRRVQ